MSKRKIGILLLLCSACVFNTYGGCKKKKAKEAAETVKVEAPAVKTTADSSNSAYDYILIERVGGGDKLFSIAPNDNNDSINAEFARYKFRDTTFALNLSYAELADSLHTMFDNILSGKQNLIKQDTAYSAKGFMLGSWMKCHAVKDTTKTLITEEKAKRALAEIERYIVSKIEVNK